MIDITLLGTGGTVPQPRRWLTSLLVKWNGNTLLVDAGEGTQIALAEKNLGCKHIDSILLTHYHADHTAGLPGLLLSMAKADRKEPVDIYGPKGLEEIVQGICLLARYIPFELHLHEYEEKEEIFYIDGLEITAFHVKHSVPCYGYQFALHRQPKFDKEKATENNVPIKCWGRLQKGEAIEVDGITYTPEMVLGEERKGLKIVYSTDTRPTQSLLDHSIDADLLITEGMYGEEEKLEKAKLNHHMLMQEAAELSLQANVKECWLTHYSPSVEEPEIYEPMLQEINPNIHISQDGQHFLLNFQNRE